MKNLIIAVISIMLFASCNENVSKEPNQSNTVKTVTKDTTQSVENFDCDTFFEKGDYSSVCFIDTKFPEIIRRGCIMSFVTKGDKHVQDIKAQFTDKNNTSLAEMHFNLNKNNYKKGDIIDVSNVGDDAFFDVHRTELKSLSRSNKDLHVRYKNISFVIYVTYQSNTEEPCFYTDKELIAVAETIIKNL